MSNTILLVEDDAMCRKAVTRYLQHLQYDVAEVTNGAEALRWIADHGDPGVIMLDIHMPVMRGDEFMAAYTGKTPVIVVSSVGTTTDLPYKPFAIADKPFCMADMVETLNTALSRGPA